MNAHAYAHAFKSSSRSKHLSQQLVKFSYAYVCIYT